MRQSCADTLATEEPDELIAHVRVCGGACWVTIGSTRKLYRKLGVRPGEVSVLGIMGKIYKGLQQPQQAIDIYQQELALRRQLGDRTGEAETLYNAAMIERDRGNLP